MLVYKNVNLNFPTLVVKKNTPTLRTLGPSLSSTLCTVAIPLKQYGNTAVDVLCAFRIPAPDFIF
jgi:hypothetical protein